MHLAHVSIQFQEVPPLGSSWGIQVGLEEVRCETTFETSCKTLSSERRLLLVSVELFHDGNYHAARMGTPPASLHLMPTMLGRGQLILIDASSDAANARGF